MVALDDVVLREGDEESDRRAEKGTITFLKKYVYDLAHTTKKGKKYYRKKPEHKLILMSTSSWPMLREMILKVR